MVVVMILHIIEADMNRLSKKILWPILPEMQMTNLILFWNRFGLFFDLNHGPPFE